MSSPDESSVIAFIGAAVRRAKRLAAVEASAWALAASGAAAGASLALHLSADAAAGAVVLTALSVASIWLARHWRARTDARAVVRRIDRAESSLRNLLVTADELSLDAAGAPDAPAAPSARPRSPLRAPPAVRSRVFADAASRLRSLDLASTMSRSSALRALSVAAGVWLLVAGTATLVHARHRAPGSVVRQQSPESACCAGESAALRLIVTIRPPAYTRLGAKTLVDPPQIEAVEGSEATLVATAGGDRVTIDHDGVSHALARGADGRFTDRLALSKTGFLVVSAGGGARRILPVVVAPDALPVVRLTSPGRDLVYSGGNPRIAFAARAVDDFGVRELSLRYTKVSGSGEQFEFKEGEMPLAIVRRSDRDWQGAATRALADLDLKEGDMLVYRAVASDARPGDGSASSDAYFIEISRLGAAAGDGFTLPEEETRYALSQQMLIVKTERLMKQRPSMAAAAVTEAALNLAVEQRMIRAEFVFMLGGEVEDEQVEAQESTELQEGRQQNRGQRDVRAATQAMSIAGRYLTGVDLPSALTAEHAAVAALQRAFSKDRYILRALATRSPLDMSRRLTGDLSQAFDWRRRVADAPENRRAALLQDLLRGLGGAAAAPTRPQILALAEQALRIDPDAAALRQASADLQRVADTWSGATAGSRARAIAAVAARVAAEAARAMAAPPAVPQSIAPSLRGAFADALRVPGGAR